MKALEDMQCASAEGSKPSLRTTAAARGIPKSTLSDHQHPKMSGDSRRYLTDEEEAQLALFISQSAEVGYGKSGSQVG